MRVRACRDCPSMRPSRLSGRVHDTNRTVPARSGHLWLRPESWDGRRHMLPKPARPNTTPPRVLTSTRSSTRLAHPRAPGALYDRRRRFRPRGTGEQRVLRPGRAG